MHIEVSERGFEFLMHKIYASEDKGESRITSQSSAVGEYDDALDNPGSSFLWFGDDHHLNREEVAELMVYLDQWLKTGRFSAPSNSPDTPS